MQQATAPSHSPGGPSGGHRRSARLDQAAPTPHAAGVPWAWFLCGGRRASCPAAPLLHGGQVMSQCGSPEEHHAGQPARPQSSARRRAMMQLWVPQKAPRSHGHWEGGSGGRRRAAFCRERFGKQRPGTGRDGAPNAAGPKGMGSIDNVLVTSLKREYWWCCLAVFPF